MPEREILTAEGPVAYTLTRKRVKNLNLRIRRDGSVAVSAPARVPLSRIDAFVLSKAPMIRTAQARIMEQARLAPGPRQYRSGERYPYLGGFLTLEVLPGPRDFALVEGSRLRATLKDPEDSARRARLVESTLEDLAREVLSSALADVYPPFAVLGVPMPELKVRTMKSRWGSCFYTRGIVTLNRRLLAAPMPCIRSVAAHELCHFLIPNHSRDFYALLSSVFPGWQTQRNILRENAARWLQ